MYRPVYVGPVRKPHCWFSHETAHLITVRRGFNYCKNATDCTRQFSCPYGAECVMGPGKALGTCACLLPAGRSFTYEGGSESSVIGVITLLIDIIGCCIIP